MKKDLLKLIQERDAKIKKQKEEQLLKEKQAEYEDVDKNVFTLNNYKLKELLDKKKLTYPENSSRMMLLDIVRANIGKFKKENNENT
jgi:hypothetical protein